jgi:NTE family protein
MTMLPAGRIDLTARAAPLHEMVGHAWPAGLWVCATRRSDGGRVAFGRAGSPAAPLAAAIRASCAIPGYFAPVTIGGVEYFDGGVHSATNADVLRRSEPDVVVVVSPMSTAQFPVGTPDALLRWAARRRLDRESRRLERAGCTVIRIEPGESSLRAMGLQPMSSERSKRVTGEAYQEVVRLIAGGGIHLPAGSAVDTVRTG